MLEERGTIERWARSQVTRIEALSAALKSMGRESYLRYLSPQMIQPFYYFEDKESEKGIPIVLQTRTFLERDDFRELRERLGALGFRYTGKGTFKGEKCTELDDLIHAYHLIKVPTAQEMEIHQ